jgi:hypothetical protein
MSIKPILFNTEMVRAILDGRKTCTRRVIKPQPNEKHTFPFGFVTDSTEKKVVGYFGFGIDEYGGSIQYVKPPYRYAPGDILYVRETWCDDRQFTHASTPGRYFYKASESGNFKWHPSIHMPKEATRIWLKVTDVRVERLHEITNEGALREGAQGIRCDHVAIGEHGCTDCMNTGWIEPPVVEFMQIWDSTIKKSDIDRYGWDANPWVWVIEFERCEKPKGV